MRQSLGSNDDAEVSGFNCLGHSFSDGEHLRKRSKFNMGRSEAGTNMSSKRGCEILQDIQISVQCGDDLL